MSKFNWSDASEEKLLDLQKQNKTTEELRRELSQIYKHEFSYKSIKNKLSRLSGVKKEDRDIEEASKISLIKRIKILENERNKQKSLVSLLCEYFDQIIPLISVKSVKVAGHVKGKNDLEFHLLLSDIHAYSKIDPESTQGLGSYNFKIFEQRLNCLIEKIILFKEEDKESQGLNRLVIHGLGDYVEGEGIFPSQAHNIEAAGTDQVVGVAEQLASIFLTLLKYFTEIEIASVSGNHSKVGGKHAGLHENFSLDYLVFYIVGILLRNTGMKNIKVFVTQSPMLLSKRGKFLFLSEHGDAIKNYFSIPWYGMERRHMKLNDLYRQNIDYHLVGHFHTSSEVNAGQIMTNGSFPGGSNLSINRMGCSSLPMQKIFYFSEKHGINRTTNLVLDIFPKLQPDVNKFLTPYRQV